MSIKTTILIVFLFVLNSTSNAAFDDYFYHKSLRIDYVHTGDDKNDYYAIDELKEEPYWGGSNVNLIDAFDYGKYKFLVYDSASNTVIYSRSYSTLFSEWQTTDEAKKTTKAFSESVILPYPKNPVRIEFYARKRSGEFEKKFIYKIDPTNYFISKERKRKYPVFDVVINGDAATSIDIVIIPEGYTKDEMELFKNDCKNMAKYLFNASPYKENVQKFNIRAVEAPSEESGADIPSQNIWKNTLLSSSFCTFNSDRYLMTTDNKTLHDVASNAPYDQIYIIVNTSKYGGGAIYNFYSLSINKNFSAEYVFTHEFGHGFAGLADEYYDSQVSYVDFFPLDVEPWEPNLTTLKSFDKKWKKLVDKSTPLPTPEEDKYYSKVGAFEGGGYIAKGVYRPMHDCSMKSISVNNFCSVCQGAIQKMIDFYSK